MVEKAITLKEEIVMDDGRNTSAGYMRDSSQSPRGCKPKPIKEGIGEPHFYELEKPGGWIQLKYRTTYKPENQGGDYIVQRLP